MKSKEEDKVKEMEIEEKFPMPEFSYVFTCRKCGCNSYTRIFIGVYPPTPLVEILTCAGCMTAVEVKPKI
jgi:hypothetical protein